MISDMAGEKIRTAKHDEDNQNLVIVFVSGIVLTLEYTELMYISINKVGVACG